MLAEPMAGKIPQGFIDELLARVDIVELIDGYVPLRKAGKNYQAHCPFHEEKTPSFSVNQVKQFYHCFGCGASGSAITFLMKHGGLGFVDAVEDLAARCGLEVPREAGYGPQQKQSAELCELLGQAAQFYRRQLREPAGERAAAYLKNRGVSAAVAETYGLGYAPGGWSNLLKALGRNDEARERLIRAGMLTRKDGGNPRGDNCYDRFRDRIMFPIHDQRGRVIGFGGRVLGDEKPKYLNTPETPVFHKGRELYGLHQARSKVKQLEKLYVVEGYMDVIALAQHGILNAVATLGTAATKEQLEKVFRTVPQAVFCFDGDEAGKKAAWRALETVLPQLREGRQALFNFMPAGEDPDTYVRKHGPEKFSSPENIVPCSSFLLDAITAQTGTSTREDRARLLDLILPYLARMPDSGLRRLLIADVAQSVGLDGAGVEEMLRGKLAQKPAPADQPRRASRRKNAGPVGELIAYLLNQPELAQLVEDPEALAGLPVAGAEVLKELIDLIHSNPGISCAAMLEHWRGTRYERRLNELASEPEALGEESFDPARQFLDGLESLKQSKARQSAEKIAQSGKPSELSEAEKTVLRQRYPGGNRRQSAGPDPAA